MVVALVVENKIWWVKTGDRLDEVAMDTTIGEIVRDPRINQFGGKLGYLVRFNRDTTIQGLVDESPAWEYADMTYGWNAALAYLEKNQTFCQNIYTKEQIKEKSSRKNAVLYDFPVDDPEAPFVLVVPGGAYFNVAVTVEGFPVAAKLNELGYHAFVLNYRAGYNCLENAVEDLHTAISYIIENADRLSVSTEGYGVMGFSAGGHLVSTLATDTYGYQTADLPKPDALILGYPVVDFNAGGGIISMCKMDAFGLFASESKVQAAYVPEHLQKDSPPLYIWHGKNDDTVPYQENSLALYQSAQEQGITVRHYAVDNGPHGMGVAKGSEAEGWLEEAIRFMEDN